MSYIVKIHLFRKDSRKDMPYQDRVSVCGKADMIMYREEYIARSVEELIKFPIEQQCQQCLNTRYAKNQGVNVRYELNEREQHENLRCEVRADKGD